MKIVIPNHQRWVRAEGAEFPIAMVIQRHDRSELPASCGRQGRFAFEINAVDATPKTMQEVCPSNTADNRDVGYAPFRR